MKLATLQRKLAKLQRQTTQLLEKREQALRDLPGSVGLKSIAELIEALQPLAGKGGRGRGKAVKTAGGKRRRAIITDATRAEVKKLVGAGKSGAEIAKALKISLPSVQNIKKALGLVKARTKS